MKTALVVVAIVVVLYFAMGQPNPVASQYLPPDNSLPAIGVGQVSPLTLGGSNMASASNQLAIQNNGGFTRNATAPARPSAFRGSPVQVQALPAPYPSTIGQTGGTGRTFGARLSMVKY